MWAKQISIWTIKIEIEIEIDLVGTQKQLQSINIK